MIAMDFWTRLLQTNLVIGLIIGIIGFAMVLLAKKIVRAYKRLEYVTSDDNAVVFIRGFGLVFILAAMFVMIIA